MRAQIIAEWAAKYTPGNNICGIYDDGLILYLSVQEKTAKDLTGFLEYADHKLETAISSDGLIWVWILPEADEEEIRILVSTWLAENKVAIQVHSCDNREQDSHTIESFAEMISPLVRK